MTLMLLKMSAIAALYVVLTVFLWKITKDKKQTFLMRLTFGLIYGMCSILSTHVAVDYGDMLLNLRDVAPLAAGLFFSPVSGVIAGIIGGVERYIVGTYFGIGSYTRIACSVSTCLAGFVAWLMNAKVFNGKKPSPVYAFFMGAVMEVFHMYVVFITHRGDMRMAFHVVSMCSVPMIVFSGLALAIMSVILQVLSGEWKNPFRDVSGEDVSVSQTFQKWLFVVTTVVIAANFAFSYIIQTQSAYQNGRNSIIESSQSIKNRYFEVSKRLTADGNEFFEIIGNDGDIVAGRHKGDTVNEKIRLELEEKKDQDFYDAQYFEEMSLNKVDSIGSDMLLLTYIPNSELYWYRNAQAYETALADILLFTVIYVLIAFLVRQIVISNIDLINASLDKITRGDLNEVVTVRNSSEFASLSDDINQTVETLKGYIAAAEKRIEQELIFARTIQESSLPRNFKFEALEDTLEIYASMKAAKEVGGDFYDFFFAGPGKLALVIADVSGKGIPAALFMMRSKTAIRSFAESGKDPAEIIFKANNTLCEGNDAEMFVTVWIGIIDLFTGVMKCANAGHEYPLIKRAGGDYEIYKDKHSLALAAMENLKAREYEIQLNPGNKIFVYTDGIPEAINEEVVQYGTDRLIRAINKVKDEPFTSVLPAVSNDVAVFRGNAEQFDDITMLGFELKNFRKH
ncbi:MAG: SpoIIE family protein phosphatase [Butyrivibrio sp.]|uniref:SpoIIE family protein phosphatase n=1 Tax=Butyrivibrio sp. TaxID=28121 RepID=UPI001AFD4E9E|nr:SpoIIE family protein phosphatase [Butyrivibrio sp.]MBO6241087.1 SpoIIE family protein phosphatase [Butyrivibrio sp.]